MSLLPHNGLISLSYKWQVSSASPTRISAFSTEVRSRVIHRPCQKFAIELFFLDFFVSSAMLKLCPMFLSCSPLEEGCFSAIWLNKNARAAWNFQLKFGFSQQNLYRNLWHTWVFVFYKYSVFEWYTDLCVKYCLIICFTFCFDLFV